MAIRTDKLRAWEALAEVLRVHQQVTSALMVSQDAQMPKPLLDATWHSYNMLRTSGRLDAKQVRIIKELVRAVIRTERQTFNPSAGRCASPPDV